MSELPYADLFHTLNNIGNVLMRLSLADELPADERELAAKYCSEAYRLHRLIDEIKPREQSAASERCQQIAERLNAIRQDWEISLSIAPSSPATLAEVNTLAGVLASLLHTLAYDEKGGTAG